MSQESQRTVRIGVSSCLTGAEVRYDGRTRRNDIVADLLGVEFELVPVCPEVEIGMPVPREPIDLVGDPANPSLIGGESGKDWTWEMADWCRGRVRGLASENLSGFVFKKKSPSCGLYGVPVIQPDGRCLDIGRGFFAAEFTRALPLVPVEEDHRLLDAHLRAAFLERVHARHRADRAFAGPWDADQIRDFHRRERSLLLAHDPQRCHRMDRLMTGLDDYRPAAFRDQYLLLHFEAFQVAATHHGHLEVLQVLTSHLQGRLSTDEQRAFIRALEGYVTGDQPLCVPVDLLRELLEKHGVVELLDQTYLDLPGLR